MDDYEYQLTYASLEDLEDLLVPRERRNPFKPVKEIKMSTEQRTRVEIVKALAEQCKTLALAGEALTLLLNEVTEVSVAPVPTTEILEAITKPKRARSVKQTNGTEPVAPPVMPDVVPVKPVKGLADLRVALQECITKHGMEEAKERLAPYQMVSAVPDEAIENVIGKLAA